MSNAQIFQDSQKSALNAENKETKMEEEVTGHDEAALSK
jgi:hypothetical protein